MTHRILLSCPLAFLLALATSCRTPVDAPPPDSMGEVSAVAAPASPSTASNAAAPPAVSGAPTASAAPTPSGAPTASAAPTPSGAPTASAAPTPSGTPTASAAPTPSGTPTASAAPAGDPLGGQFTLADATQGLPKSGRLVAELLTDAGKLNCTLYEDRAPITVANFVGLARGLRPFRDASSRAWVKRPAYDGVGFHRIIRGFMIQGGDPTGTGQGEAGYLIPDEVWAGAKHDRRGLLCMANRGKNTNSMQFFITDGAAPHLDGGYTIFGECSPDSVIEKLAQTEVRGDRAVTAPKIKKITVKRLP